MKRFFVLLAILFCGVVFADTITINWGVNNQPYTTTTCEVGGDVILPAVSKRGHVFRGWQAEHFDRGTFANWSVVPTNANLYSEDYVGNRTPTNNDYMVVSDASGYQGGYDKVVNFTWKNELLYGSPNKTNMTFVDVTSGTTSTLSRGDYRNEARTQVGNIYVKLAGFGLTIYFYSDSGYSIPIQVEYNGNLVASITYNEIGERAFTIKYAYGDASYEGSWRFIYVGTWATDGKTGWQPDVQISNE